MKNRTVMMMLLMVGLGMVQTAGYSTGVVLAQEAVLSEPYCDGSPAFEVMGAKFDIREGLYAPEVSDVAKFCGKYSVTKVEHYPCSKNVSSFTWTCVNGNQVDFSCTEGKCTEKNGSREILLRADCADAFTYKIVSDKVTEMRYVGPSIQ